MLKWMLNPRFSISDSNVEVRRHWLILAQEPPRGSAVCRCSRWRGRGFGKFLLQALLTNLHHWEVEDQTCWFYCLIGRIHLPEVFRIYPWSSPSILFELREACTYIRIKVHYQILDTNTGLRTLSHPFCVRATSENCSGLSRLIELGCHDSLGISMILVWTLAFWYDQIQVSKLALLIRCQGFQELWGIMVD